MKKPGIVVAISLLLVLAALVGCSGAGGSGESTGEESQVRTFADWTDVELFQDIPAMIVKDAKVESASDYGGKDYVLGVSGTELSDYQDYLQLLEENGFTKYVDNGAEGLDGAVYTATYTRGELVLTVTQAVKYFKTYLSACEGLPLSDHLFYDESYVADNREGAETTLHMVELYDGGNSFILQMKNGHFIMNDGGNPQDLPYLLDYLESLVPEGEKPVIDAWFISHAHGDHAGWLKTMIAEPSYIDRIYVESFYFSQPSDAVGVSTSATADIQYFMMNYKFLKSTAGTAPVLYRPQTGQRYYFNDFTVDVMFAQEQLPLNNYSGDYNDSSTWLMYNIEGQKFLLAGDAEYGSVRSVMRMYDEESFAMDIFTVFHHGINVYDYFTDFCSFTVALYPNYRCGSGYSTGVHAHDAENAHIIESAEEIASYGKGTVVMAFPYEVGTMKILPAREWIYESQPRTFGEQRLEVFENHIINK